MYEYIYIYTHTYIYIHICMYVYVYIFSITKLWACRAAITKSRQRDALISRAVVVVHPGYAVPAAVSTNEIGSGSEKDSEWATNLEPELRIISAPNSMIPEEVAARADRCFCYQFSGQDTHGELCTLFDLCGDKTKSTKSRA